MSKYSASLSRTQGRAGYCVIFRHPVRREKSSGNPGLKVRKGLGTRDLAEAERLKDQLDQLLQDPVYWSGASMNLAQGRFDPRVVNIFFDQIVPEPKGLTALREEAIPLAAPGSGGCPRVLIVGPSGAGKTSLVCQLTGITEDHIKAGALATAVSRTTAHELELFVDPQSKWRVVLTFTSVEEVREHVNECIAAAARAAAAGRDRKTVLDRLLRHADQRLRFDLMLGSELREISFDDDEPEMAIRPVCTDEQYAAIDLKQTEVVLDELVDAVTQLGLRQAKALRENGGRQGRDETYAFSDECKQRFDVLLRNDEIYFEIGDRLIAEIEERFKLLLGGTVTKSVQGWPLSWRCEWPAEDAGQFFRVVAPLIRIQRNLWGRLLTPLVNGVRLAGPFVPKWISGEAPKFVLLDGVGLSGVRDPSVSVPTVVSRQMHEADAILLVTNAAASSHSTAFPLLREAVLSGNVDKLIFVYTHFDLVHGDSLESASARAQHVLALTDELIVSIGEELGPSASAALRKRLGGARFFLSNIQRPLSEDFQADRRTLKQLRSMLSAITKADASTAVAASPEYHHMGITMAAFSAADAFQHVWRARLGIEINPGIARESWQRVRSLARRLGYGVSDEYEALRPVGDLRLALLVRIYRVIQNPSSWIGSEPTPAEKQIIYNRILQRLSLRLLDLVAQLIGQERATHWRKAYEARETSSADWRARVINDEILDIVAPKPELVGTSGQEHFLRKVNAAFEAALGDLDAETAKSVLGAEKKIRTKRHA